MYVSGRTFICSASGCRETFSSFSPHREIARFEAESEGWTIDPGFTFSYCPIHRGPQSGATVRIGPSGDAGHLQKELVRT